MDFRRHCVTTRSALWLRHFIVIPKVLCGFENRQKRKTPRSAREWRSSEVVKLIALDVKIKSRPSERPRTHFNHHSRGEFIIKKVCALDKTANERTSWSIVCNFQRFVGSAYILQALFNEKRFYDYNNSGHSRRSFGHGRQMGENSVSFCIKVVIVRSISCVNSLP